jgi:hypothetical protein
MVDGRLPAPSLGLKPRAPARELHPAMEARKWKPGESGNPGGKTGQYHEAMRICREASPEAAKKMVELMGCDDPRVAYMATNAVMERAWGKPREYDPNADPEGRSAKFAELVARWTPEQRALARQLFAVDSKPGTGA